MYDQTHGTFPLDSKEVATRAWNLIHKFLSEYQLPGAADSPEQWKCPRFVPGEHLVCVRKVYGAPQSLYRAEIYLVRVLPPGSRIRDFSSPSYVDEHSYAAIHPTQSPHLKYPTLLIERVILPQYSGFQDVYAFHPCIISSLTEETDPFILHEASRPAFENLYLQAKKSISEIYAVKNSSTVSVSE